MITALQPYTVVSSGGLVMNETERLEDQSRYAKLEATFNQLLLSRREFMNRLLQRNRNIDEDCGYPVPWTTNGAPNPQQWKDLNDWDGIAGTINELMAVECFQSQYEVYEDADPETETELEAAVADLPNQLEEEPSHFIGDNQCVISGLLKEAWVKACTSRYGIILFGFDDIKPGDANGLAQPVQVAPYPGRRLLYLRVFGEHLARVSQWDTDQLSPRYGRPLYYEINLASPDDALATATTATSSLPAEIGYTRRVHFSRVLHVCKLDGDHPYYHKPECQDVIKYIVNLQKVYGANGEGHWRGAFSTISIETNNPDVIPNKQELTQMIEDWDRGLLKVWALDGGLTAKTLPPSLTDPTAAVEINLRAIAMRKRIPKRKLEGSERGELASGQDDGDWNDVVRAYQYNILNPRLVIPFYNRLINVGVLPRPGKGQGKKGKNGNGTATPLNGQPKSGTGVLLGEPFRTQPGQIVSPSLAPGEYPPNTPVNRIAAPDSPNGTAVQLSTSPSATTAPTSSPRGRQRREVGFYVFWPDIAMQTDDDKLRIGSGVITAIGDAIQKGVLDHVTLRDTLVGIFRGLFTEDEVDAWLDNAEEARENEELASHKQAALEQELEQKKIDAGLAVNPVEQMKAQHDAETEAKMNAIAQTPVATDDEEEEKPTPPVGNAEYEWDGETWDLASDPYIPLTNAKKASLSGGRWVTTDEGHHIYLKGGKPVAGNPHVIAKLQDKPPPTKSSKQQEADAHAKSSEAWGQHGKAVAGKTKHEDAAKAHEEAAKHLEKVGSGTAAKLAKEHQEAAADLKNRKQSKDTPDSSAVKSTTDREVTKQLHLPSPPMPPKVTDRKSGIEYATQTHGEWGKSLNDKQKKAIDTYTSSEYLDINKKLRESKGGSITSPKLKGVVTNLDAAIASAPPFEHDHTLYRGIGNKLLGQLKPGMEFQDQTYTSTSINRDVAGGFVEDAILHIRAPKGTRAAAIDATPEGVGRYKGPLSSENEYLLPRGTKFKVGKIEKHPDGYDVVHVDII